MTVYIIASGDSGLVKIGHGTNPLLRIKNMQTGNPEPLRLLALFDGGEKEERFLHGMFTSQRVRREWFRFTPQMLDGAGLTKAEPPSRKKVAAPKKPKPDIIAVRDQCVAKNRPAILEKAFSQRGVIKQIARSVGYTSAAVSLWRQVPERHLDLVAEITGIATSDLRPDLHRAA